VTKRFPGDELEDSQEYHPREKAAGIERRRRFTYAEIAARDRNRRQREVAMQANLSALRLRPWDGVTVTLERLTPFPARVTGWALAPDGGVNLQLERFHIIRGYPELAR
jgi:hypothetical protein